jgi:cytochrome P450
MAPAPGPAVDPVALTPKALGFDPADPAFIADPYPALARLRADHPVLWNPETDQWIVSRAAHVNALLRDRRLGRTYLHVASHAEMGKPEDVDWHAPWWRLVRDGMLDREPPDHTRLRRLVSAAFTPRTVESLRDRIGTIVGGLVDRAVDLGEFDLVADLAEPLPVAVIAELLGIPDTDRPLLRPWSADICLMYELNPPEASQRRAVAAAIAFGDYLRDLTRARRRRPGDDLVSRLAQSSGDDGALTEDEVVGTCALLLNAGHEASVNGAGNAWWSLFRHPEALRRLREEPGLLTTAVDELLRHDTPLPMFERWALEDVEVDGIRIPRGSEIALQFASANRDPDAFDRPDEVLLDRRPNHLLSFGAGIHYCLGAPLARLELSILFRHVLERLPRLEPVRPPTWKPTWVLRGLRDLRVRA